MRPISHQSVLACDNSLEAPNERRLPIAALCQRFPQGVAGAPRNASLPFLLSGWQRFRRIVLGAQIRNDRRTILRPLQTRERHFGAFDVVFWFVEELVQVRIGPIAR